MKAISKINGAGIRERNDAAPTNFDGQKGEGSSTCPTFLPLQRDVQSPASPEAAGPICRHGIEPQESKSNEAKHADDDGEGPGLPGSSRDAVHSQSQH